MAGRLCQDSCDCGRHRGNGKKTGRKRIDNPGVIARHDRVKTARGKASEYCCNNCESNALDWAQIHETTGLEIDHYIPLCRRCHVIYDRGPDAFSVMRDKGR